MVANVRTLGYSHPYSIEAPLPMAIPATRAHPRASRSSNLPKDPERSSYSRLFQRGNRKGKVRKEFWLDPKLLRTVKEELGAATEREAVEMALDLVLFRKELTEGARRLVGLGIKPLDE
jgi:hypothetical protein